MSIIVEFFAAADDASAAEVLYGGPEVSGYETVSCGNFIASFAMTEWESLLTHRSPEDHENAEDPRIVAADGDPDDPTVSVFAASPFLQNALASADEERLTEVAHVWAAQYSEEWGLFEPDTAARILFELADLARSANAERHTVYCWMC